MSIIIICREIKCVENKTGLSSDYAGKWKCIASKSCMVYVLTFYSDIQFSIIIIAYDQCEVFFVSIDKWTNLIEAAHRLNCFVEKDLTK